MIPVLKGTSEEGDTSVSYALTTTAVQTAMKME